MKSTEESLTNRDNQSLAQSLFKDKDLLNGRPEGMDFEVYKIMRRVQTKLIKQSLKK